MATLQCLEVGSSYSSLTLGWHVLLFPVPRSHVRLQLLRNLKHSVATLQVSGEWGTGSQERDEATLEVHTDRVWLQGHASQRRLARLQVRAGSPWRSMSGAAQLLTATRLAARLTIPLKHHGQAADAC